MALIRMRLDSIACATPDIAIFSFSAADGGTLPPAEAGAHIDLHLKPGLVRQYSLLRPAPAPHAYTVGIKKEAGGRGGSLHAHEALRIGDEIEVGGPRNNFPLVEDAGHCVLIAGGIGITPIWAMAQRLQELGRSWSLHLSCRSRADAPLLDEIAATDCASMHFDDEAGGFVDLAAIVAAAPRDAHFFCCGPAPMLAAYRAATAHLPAGHVHDEAFAAAPAAAGDTGFVVHLAVTGLEVAIPADRSILDTLRAHGVDAMSSCEAGVCGMCETRVLEGAIDHRDHVLSPDEQAANDRMMICCSRARSARLVLDL